ncbi:MAG: VWA domain-containing protein [Planctomycetes bacterium]|nr:VWA domain-containing protein [Planctomycetota bacterium]
MFSRHITSTITLAALTALAAKAPSQCIDPPTQWVIILDVTGSTGSLLPNWKANMDASMIALIDATIPGSKFALVEHRDFPFSPYGGSSDYPYRLVAPMTPYSNWASVQAQLDLMTATGGGDTPESQLVAIDLALTGGGLDLNADSDYLDPGEVDPLDNQIGAVLGQRIGIIHFTYPDIVHDRDLEPNYPQPGIPNLMTAGLAKVNLDLLLFSCVSYNLMVTEPLDDSGGTLEALATQTGGVTVNAGTSLENLRGATLEILRNAGASPAAVTRRNSVPPNPQIYAAQPMIPGTTWTASILLGTSTTSPNFGVFLASYRPNNIPFLPNGILLIDPTVAVLQSPFIPKTFGFARFSLPIPNFPSLQGLTLFSQGATLGSTWGLTNAEDLLIGDNPVPR